MRRRWSTAAASALAVGVMILLASLGGAASNATPTAEATPRACGRFDPSPGGASANDVEIRLIEARLSSATDPSAASPVPLDQLGVRLLAVNRSDATVDVVAGDVSVVTCVGREVFAETRGRSDAFDGTGLAPGAEAEGWLWFALEADDPAVTLIVPVSSPDLTGGRVEFPLTSHEGDACDARGADVVGGDGVSGEDATATGGDAVGGEGADGGDAVGGDAIAEAVCDATGTPEAG